jgi:hypothetical protein
MATAKEHVQKFKAAHRLASTILASAHPGLPDENNIHHLATAIFVHGIKATDGEARTANHAGQDSDSEDMLRRAYAAEGQDDQQSRS